MAYYYEILLKLLILLLIDVKLIIINKIRLFIFICFLYI